YRELLRASQLWQMLKHLKWRGRWGESQSSASGSSAAAMYGATDIPTFCVACPQPGVNLPENWTEDPDQMAYTRTFVMDGNFTIVHQKRENAHHDIKLTHLAVAKEKLTCNEHHAVND
ncbi:hypothetical protein L208DRAFT_997736, partial [Tricholoma matsutake]